MRKSAPSACPPPLEVGNAILNGQDPVIERADDRITLPVSGIGRSCPLPEFGEEPGLHDFVVFQQFCFQRRKLLL